MAISTGANIVHCSLDEIEEAKQKYIAKTGRPSKFNPETAAEIVARIANGETITSIFRDKSMPSNVTYYDWKEKIPDFARACERAEQAHYDARIAQAVTGLDEADGTTKDNQVRKAEAIARLSVDLAARRNYKRWGEKSQNLNVNINADMSPVDLSAWVNSGNGATADFKQSNNIE